MIQRHALLEIISETIQETLTDIQDTAEAITVIADVSLDVAAELSAFPTLLEQTQQSRSVRTGRLTADVLKKLRQHYEIPSGTISEEDRDPFLEKA